MQTSKKGPQRWRNRLMEDVLTKAGKKRDPIMSNVVPACIPPSAVHLYLTAGPKLRKKLIAEADQPERVVHGLGKPNLASQKRKAKGEQLCMCHDMRYCPLVASGEPKAPTKDGMTYQFYPTDRGWWRMRECVIKLAHVTSAANTKDDTSDSGVSL